MAKYLHKDLEDERRAMNLSLKEIVETHFDKCMRTNESLMKLVGISFHFERLQSRYLNTKTAETVVVLMARARKLFDAIARCLTIFRLID